MEIMVLTHKVDVKWELKCVQCFYLSSDMLKEFHSFIHSVNIKWNIYWVFPVSQD